MAILTIVSASSMQTDQRNPAACLFKVDTTLFALDGKHANLTVNDVQRRNRITRLLADWGLITVVKQESIADIAPLNQIKVLSYKDKGDWILEQKYNIGKKGKTQETE